MRVQPETHYGSIFVKLEHKAFKSAVDEQVKQAAKAVQNADFEHNKGS